MDNELSLLSQSGRWPSTETDGTTVQPYIPPHSIEAEQAVLGGLMLDNKAWDRISELVSASEFIRHDHRLIFAAIASQAGRNEPCDVVTLSDSMTRRGQLEQSGGLAYLVELAKNTPSVANIRSYAKIIRERAILRALMQTSQETIDQAMNPDGRSVGEILDAAGARVLAIGQQTDADEAFVDGMAMLDDYLDYADHRFNNPHEITGVSTGFVDLDALLSGNGMQNDDLIIVAGRPSSGKTTFGMNIAEAALQRSTGNVVVFSVEMPKRSLMQRMMASLGRFELGKAINPTPSTMTEDDWLRMSAAASKLKPVAHRLFCNDTSAISPSAMRSYCRRLKRERGAISIIVVDYLQLMTVPGIGANDRVAEISEISRSLKSLAKEFGCPVVALSQLSRKCEDRPNKRPVNSDLRESGAIEQDADVIFMVYRDEVYHPDTRYKGIAEIICTKQRNGAIGTSYLAFLGKFACFDNLAPGSLPADEPELPRHKGKSMVDRFEGSRK